MHEIRFLTRVKHGLRKVGRCMEEMLMTQALDERDLLVKKISDKIRSADFIATIRHNEEKVSATLITREDFEKKAKSQLQQIQDLIARYQRIDAAIINSNANTFLELSIGTCSVAAAIAMRSRLKETSVTTDFDLLLIQRMQNAYRDAVRVVDSKNQRVQMSAEEMRNSILGKDSKGKDNSPLDVVDVYVKENSFELVDPLGLKDRIEALTDTRDSLLRELDTKIKVSNATTKISF